MFSSLRQPSSANSVSVRIRRNNDQQLELGSVPFNTRGEVTLNLPWSSVAD